MQDVELVAGFQHHQFTRGRDAEEPSLHPHRRAEEIAAHAFLVTELARGSLQTTDDAAVAPKPDVLAHRDAGGDVGSGALKLVNLLRRPRGLDAAGPDGSDEIAAPATAAGTEDHIGIAGDDG